MNSPTIKIKAVLFDMDGVLLDAKDIHKEALNRALAFNGSEPISEEEHNRSFDGLPTKQKLEMLESLGRINKEDFAIVNQLKQDMTSELIAKMCHPNQNHLLCLMSLEKKGYKMALCSNSIRRTVDAALEVTCLRKFFKFSLSNEDVSLAKPNPEIYEEACIKLGLNPEEVLVVEDNVNGIRAAEDAGCFVLRVTDGINQVTEGFVLNKISEIENA